MKNVISILKFVNNSVSGESISLGLVAISENRVFFKVSNQKIQLAKKLNTKSGKLLDFSIKQLAGYLAHDLESVSEYNKSEFKTQLNSTLLDRLSRYNNGLLQFSYPSAIQSEFNELEFQKYFDQFIGKEEAHANMIRAEYSPSKLESNMESKFIAPLANRIDLNITIKKKQLPTLFFDFNVDGLGANGSLYVVKSIDLDIVKAQNAKATISEYESLLHRLIEYSRSKNIKGEPMTYLVMDPPQKDGSESSDLYRFLKNEKMDYFKVISSDALGDVTNEIIQSEAHKFSPDLLPLK